MTLVYRINNYKEFPWMSLLLMHLRFFNINCINIWNDVKNCLFLLFLRLNTMLLKNSSFYFIEKKVKSYQYIAFEVMWKIIRVFIHLEISVQPWTFFCFNDLYHRVIHMKLSYSVSYALNRKGNLRKIEIYASMNFLILYFP